MSKSMQSMERKVRQIFEELVGERAKQFDVAVPIAQNVIKRALRNDYDKQTAFDIAFHMTDWNGDAAIICAFLMFPERFTPAEIRHGISCIVVHAPNHLAAAAKHADFPVDDVWGIGALENAKALYGRKRKRPGKVKKNSVARDRRPTPHAN